MIPPLLAAALGFAAVYALATRQLRRWRRLGRLLASTHAFYASWVALWLGLALVGVGHVLAGAPCPPAGGATALLHAGFATTLAAAAVLAAAGSAGGES